MKKVLFFLAFFLTGIFSFGQTLNKGNLLGLHIETVTLKEGVTMADYENFVTGKVIPAYNKAFPGMKVYLITSLRGTDSSSVGVLYMFNTEADRNKYFNKEGNPTELFNASAAKVADIQKEFDKFVVSSNAPDRYNDWLVK